MAFYLVYLQWQRRCVQFLSIDMVFVCLKMQCGAHGNRSMQMHADIRFNQLRSFNLLYIVYEWHHTKYRSVDYSISSKIRHSLRSLKNPNTNNICIGLVELWLVWHSKILYEITLNILMFFFCWYNNNCFARKVPFTRAILYLWIIFGTTKSHFFNGVNTLNNGLIIQ